MLLLFIMLKNAHSKPYIRPLIADLVVTMHARKTEHHKAYALFRHDPSVYNESSGETSLSLLARYLRANPHRTDIDVVRDRYVTISLDDPNDDMTIEAQEDRRVRRGRHIKANSREVLATCEHFSSVVRQLRAKRWRHYDRTRWFELMHGVEGTDIVPEEKAPLAVKGWDEVKVDLRTAFTRTHDDLHTFWSQQFNDIVPALLPSIQSDPDDFSLSEEDVEDGKEIKDEEDGRAEAPRNHPPQAEQEEDEKEIVPQAQTLSEVLGHEWTPVETEIVKVGTVIVLKWADSWERGTIKRKATDMVNFDWDVKWIRYDGRRDQKLEKMRHNPHALKDGDAPQGTWFVVVKNKRKGSKRPRHE